MANLIQPPLPAAIQVALFHNRSWKFSRRSWNQIGFGLLVHVNNDLMHPNSRPIAQALLAARQRKGWSQYRLAVHAGLHPNTVSLAERSGHFSERTAERTAERLAAALDIPVESLRGEG